MGFLQSQYHFCLPDRPDDQPSPKPSPVAPLHPPRVTSRQLLGPHGELIIEHQGREYRLRLTQNGKLILTA
jgi:hemin uptake protein HemP